MVIRNFLNNAWLDFVRAEIGGQAGSLSREGYANKKTLRDHLDPRYAETKYIDDPRNILCKVWDKFLWDSPTEELMQDSEDSAFLHACYTRVGKTLLSSYGNGDYYGSHIDIDLDCIVTAVLMLTMTDEKMFEGGDFVLEDKIEPFENNKLILFASCREHAVTPVILPNDCYTNRRFTLQYFISAVPARSRFPDESRNK